MTQLVRSASDAKQVAYAEKVKERREQERRDLVRAQMSSPQGRAFVWGELARLGVHDYEAGPLPIESLAYYTGRRAGGGELAAEVRFHHPDLYHVMMQEAAARGRHEEEAITAAVYGRQKKRDEETTDTDD